MDTTTHGPEPEAENLPPLVVVSKSSPTNTNEGDVLCENGDGERPVREKLKKTSIAQMANGTTPPRVTDGETAPPQTSVADDKEDVLMEVGGDSPEKQSRPVSKRPFPDAEENEAHASDAMDMTINGHAYKKSRDERSAKIQEEDDEQGVSSSESMEEESKETALEATLKPADADGSDNSRSESTTVTPPSTEPVDHEMKEEILSPRKKRSRDQFEAESQEREQKVAATEQSKLRRRSLELKRSSWIDPSKDTSSSIEAGESDKPEERKPTADRPSVSISELPSGVSSDVSELSPSGADARSTSPSRTSPAPQIFGQSTQTSSNAFASSGFAALANSSPSPFGALASSKPSNAASTKAAPDAPKPSISATLANNTQDSKQRVFGSATPIIPLAKETEKPSAFGPPLGSFAKSPTSGFSSLGSSGFGSLAATQGSAFSSSPFASGPTKLSSFAAPTGDAKLAPAAAKPFGAPAEEGEESDEGSEVASEEGEEKRGEEKRDKRGEDKKEKKERDGVADPRFHKQETRDGEDAEDTIFQSPRAKLYAFTDGKWKERGTGPFKLNVLHPAFDEGEMETRPTARFIMRAQLTHRLVLNMPLFKDMDFKEPQGGKLTFSASQDGNLVGHVLKIKEEEARLLYQKLKRIQTKL